MNCDDCRQRLQACLDGEPPGGDGVEVHVAACPACRALDAAARRRGSVLAAPALTPPAGFAERIVARVLADRRRRQRCRRRLVLGGIGLAAAASLLVAFLLPTREPKPVAGGPRIGPRGSGNGRRRAIPPSRVRILPLPAVPQRQRRRGDLGRRVPGPAHRGRDAEQWADFPPRRAAGSAVRAGVGRAGGAAGEVLAPRGGQRRHQRPRAGRQLRPPRLRPVPATCRPWPRSRNPACNAPLARSNADDHSRPPPPAPPRASRRLSSPPRPRRPARRTAPPRPRRRGLLPGRAGPARRHTAALAASPFAEAFRKSPLGVALKDSDEFKKLAFLDAELRSRSAWRRRYGRQAAG